MNSMRLAACRAAGIKIKCRAMRGGGSKLIELNFNQFQPATHETITERRSHCRQAAINHEKQYNAQCAVAAAN